MRRRIAWPGVVVSMAICVALGRAGGIAAQGEPSGATPAPLPAKGGSPARVTLEGFVLAPEGSPAEGAVVVSSAGGKAVTDAAGSYRLVVEISPDATSVQVTAVGKGGGSPVASTGVPLNGATGFARVDPLSISRGTTCSPSWLPTFPGMPPGTDGVVNALAVFDDGNGPALFVGGDFSVAGIVAANGIARWEGSSWSALGSGLGGSSPRAEALTVYDDGGGPALYVGGAFTSAGGVTANRIARWDGSSWAAVGGGTNGIVYALAVYDDGNGAALHAGGGFTNAGGLAASRIARWDGSSWATLGTGMNPGQGAVYALAVHDDGSGPALYAGGSFPTAGGVTVNHIARWDGASWAALGSGMSDTVRAVAVYDDGGGPALYAAGRFTMAGGTAASRIAKWDGSSWAALGSGVNDTVRELAVYDDGGGPALYAGGSFTAAGGAAASRIAKWDGQSWSALGSGTSGTVPFAPEVYALAVYDNGGGSELYVGGAFSMAGGVGTKRIAKWNGSSWSAFSNGISDSVWDMTVHDDGSGPALYVGGLFTSAGGAPVNHIARWSGSSWSTLGSGVNGYVSALGVFDDGSGPALYASGSFTTAGGVPANSIAKWDGSNWQPLSSGIQSRASAIAVYDDGGGPALYVGGYFNTAGGVPASKVAKWDGSSWSALGSGMTPGGGVEALAVHDDGSGPALYAGGGFSSAGGVAASNIAKWNGSSWSPVGNGRGGAVLALAVFDDGGGPELYAGGYFTILGGVTAQPIARWDGSSWSPLGMGVNDAVVALAAHDDGGGSSLYVAGIFTLAGGMAVNRIAKWDGASWLPLGSGLSGTAFDLEAHDDGSGAALYAGGSFDSAFDSGDTFLAKWGCDSVPPTVSCPPSVSVLERWGSSPGEFVSFTVTASDAGDPAPLVVCIPPSGSFFPRGTTIVTCTATDASGNQSTCEFPVTVALKVRRR